MGRLDEVISIGGFECYAFACRHCFPDQRHSPKSMSVCSNDPSVPSTIIVVGLPSRHTCKDTAEVSTPIHRPFVSGPGMPVRSFGFFPSSRWRFEPEISPRFKSGPTRDFEDWGCFRRYERTMWSPKNFLASPKPSASPSSGPVWNELLASVRDAWHNAWDPLGGAGAPILGSAESEVSTSTACQSTEVSPISQG